MDTGDAPSSFDVGTDGGFYGGQTPTDAGLAREAPRGSRGWLVLLGSAVLMAGIVGGGLSWLLPAQASAEAQTKAQTEAKTKDGTAGPAEPVPAAAGVLDDELRALARANAPQRARALPWAERHALLQQLAAGPHAGRVDQRLHLALDLQQAAQAEAPCQAFAEALARVEAASDPYFADALAAARAPEPSCAQLDERREGLHRSLVVPPSEAGPEPAEDVAASEPVDDAPEARRASRRARKPRRSQPAASKPAPSKPVEPPPAKKEPTPKVGGKLHDELRPFGK